MRMLRLWRRRRCALVDDKRVYINNRVLSVLLLPLCPRMDHLERVLTVLKPKLPKQALLKVALLRLRIDALHQASINKYIRKAVLGPCRPEPLHARARERGKEGRAGLGRPAGGAADKVG